LGKKSSAAYFAAFEWESNEENILSRCFVLLRVAFVVGSLLLGSALRPDGANSGSPAPGLLVVANQYEHSVLLVDPEKRTAVAKINVGVNGHEVIVSKDGRFAYVPIYGNSGVGKPGTDGSTIDVIDIQAGKLAGSIDLGKPLRPHRAEFGPDGMLYVTAELAKAVDVVDPSTRKVLAEIPTGQEQSHMLVLSPDGRRGYTANVSVGSVSVLDLAKRSLITTIPVAKSVQRISISADGHRVFTHDQDTPRIAVIDTATNKITDWIALPNAAYASEPTPDGRWLLALSMVADRLFVVDLQTLKVVHALEVPKGSSEILLQPGGGMAYVSGTKAGKIAVLNLLSWQIQESIDLTPGVDGLAWASSLPK
jgi:DNA-binding beta-propeller fold protein YncE